jgi:hypothetical protein
MSRIVWFAPLLLATSLALADDAPQATPQADAAATDAKENKDADPKEVSGMSILGNQEAPKALVLVPWKSSEIGASLGIETMLDDSKEPVDKEVFMRALSYYEIRSQTDAAQPATASQRRKS